MCLFCPRFQRCENKTQVDFIAEQCSKTDSQALYLRPKSASFYTWIPAVGFTQGGLREMYGNMQAKAMICTFFPSSPTSRRGTVPIPVPVRWRELPREPWFSVCGWNSLRVRPSTSIWLHCCVFERHVSGSDESNEECQLTDITPHLLIPAAYLFAAVWL